MRFDFEKDERQYPRFLFPGIRVTVRRDDSGWLVTPKDLKDGVSRLIRRGITLCGSVERHGSDWREEVAGYWNLKMAEFIDGTDDWPFGCESYDWRSAGLLASFLPDGRVVAPRIPAFEEARDWLVAKDLDAPGHTCNCNAVHHGPGKVVGLKLMDMCPVVQRCSSNLVVLEHDRGTHGAIPERILSVKDAQVLRFIDPPDSDAGATVR